MKIAIAADGCDMESKVTAKFADACWLLIVEMDRQRICEKVRRGSQDTENEEFAKIIVQRNCESVICGEIERIPFEILAAAGVTRSLGAGLTIPDAIEHENMLELITDHIGGTGHDSHSHHAETCSCGHDE
ncbi:MAG: hypothetical protein FNP40_10305 [Dehalobacter sp. 4CP]|uniref:NifB/NifX family molybdenum-iron cluster-binding protein n=1 Tax=Dehalobacter sp. CP TaxID=2594474 RepID=UPI0013C59CD1|nr:hypothetical protein [Dehalobacter sp.]NBJ15929.1 hypothetical protein [Dehalobacter sp. 4CP]